MSNRYSRCLYLILTACLLIGAGTACSRGGTNRNPPADPSGKSNAPRAGAREITIRNVTGGDVVYRIKTAHTKGNGVEKIIMDGIVDRFPGDQAMDISFKREDIWIRYRLDAGRPYSFRNDEFGELELYDGSHGREDVADLAPYVATPMIVVERMLELADVTENDVVYDLGCGDGRIVITAAKKFGARGVGIDLDPERIEESRRNAREAGVESLVAFLQEDAMRADLSDATIVTLYLLTESNALLRPMLEKSLRPGAKVISHNYDIPGWGDKEVDYISVQVPDGETHSIYLYKR